MRLPVERGLPLRAITATLALFALTGCGQGSSGAGLSRTLPTADRNGPAADYPMVLGEPFAVDGVTYTPTDTMNYDQVGYAAVAAEGGTGISLAHRTLPLPSYVEVTSLTTGRTILVRVERRGPMTGATLVELSPGAAAQLGIAGGRAPVRVRRVNPVEPERAMLRSGQRAPERMDTPLSLAGVLMRKLEPNGPAAAPVPVAPPLPAVTATAAQAATVTPNASAPARRQSGAFAVQVGAFSDAARASAVAGEVGGSVSAAGRLHRVRITGFASAADARAALAKVQSAGYSDARIQRAD